MPGLSAANSEIVYRFYDSKLIEYSKFHREARNALDLTSAARRADSHRDSDRAFQSLRG